MKLTKLINGKALYVTSDKIWVAQGMNFFVIDFNGNRVSRIYCVGTLKDKLLSSCRLIRQLLRVGLHHLLIMKNGNIIVTAKRKTYIFSTEGKILNVFTGYNGNKPVHQGICVTPNGNIFFGEYVLNPNRDMEVRLYRSSDNGMSFNVVKTFIPGEIRHIHFVKWDKYEQCLWMGTGDYGNDNRECCLFRSADNGDTWELIGQGSQDWRAIGICFTKDSIIWGADAGSCPEPVHLIKMDRTKRTIEVLDDFEGPCHGCASYNDGRIFFSTGIEGGENEKGRYAILKEYKEGIVLNIWKLKKDIWPSIVQYGVIRFPLGTDQCNRVVFTAMGLKGHGEIVMIEK